MTSPKHQVEALLFSSGKAMTVDQIAEFVKMDKAKAVRALKAVQKDYQDHDSALELVQDGDTWKMGVRNEHLMLVKNIVADTELSRACMETLAVIAYKYPKALQSDVVDTRGSGAYDHIAELERLGFIRKDPSGRSYNLKLTEKFFSYFDLQGEKDIKAVFKGVKKPENDRQRKLGEMDVVAVEQKPETPLPGMEVVGVEPLPEKQEVVRDLAMDESHKKFLDDLEARIDAVTKRNDEHADDPLLKRKEESLPEETQDAEDRP